MKISSIDPLTLYAAIVSTLVACIELFRFVREIRSKLVIDLLVYVEDSVDDEQNVISRKMISVNIVNRSASDRVITRQPWLTLNTTRSRITLPTEDIFPKRLLPGDACEFLYDFKSIQTWAEDSRAFKLQATIDDTYGKKYKSKWVKIY